MPRKKLELTKMPMPAGVPQRWRKIYKGSNYYFRGNYTAALQQWEAKKVELTQADRLTMVEVIGIQAARLVNEARDLASITDESAAGAIVAEWRGKATSVRNIAQAVEQFLSRRALKVSAGTQSAGYYATLKRCLDDFSAFIGRNLGVDRIDGQTWESYCSKLLERQAGGLSAEYVRTYQGVAKTFILWAWRTGLLKDLPRNLADRDLAISTPAKTIKLFSIDEIKTLLANSHKRTRLFLLLALNCGFTQKDIADLKPDEVDWKGKRIIRKRSKEKDAERVPTVEYPLWQATYDLLTEFRSENPDRVLTNEDGKPLWIETMKDGKVAKIDNIKSAYSRLLTRLAKKKTLKTIKTFKIFRKTSPSILQKSSAHCHVARHFLGHAPGGVADKHYVTPDQKAFAAAIKWLGKQYQVDALAD